MQIEKGSFTSRKLPSYVFGAPQCWLFWIISCTKSKLKGAPFYEKFCQCMYLRPHILKKCRFLIISPKWTNCRFFNFMYKIKIQRGYILWKKLTSSVFRTPLSRPFWWKVCLPTGQIWANQIFLIILYTKYKIILGQFYVKTCYSQKFA